MFDLILNLGLINVSKVVIETNMKMLNRLTFVPTVSILEI